MKRTRPDDVPDDLDESLKKCAECRFCYMHIATCEWYCSKKKGCKFEALTKEKKKFKQKA